MKKVALVTSLAVVFLIAVIGGTISFVGWDFLSKPASTLAPQEIVYEVSLGKGFNSIASDLEDKGIIRSSQLFSLYARIIGERSKIKVGEYLFRSDMKPRDVLDVLTSGKSIARSFTVSEGLSIYEISDLYERQGFGRASEFMRLVKDKEFIQSLLKESHDSLEGYLFPETYMLTKYTDTKALITNMVKRFLHVYESNIPSNALPGWTRHQIVTLASIIEKETGAPEERPIISSVFHNRLQKKMRLQTDPTVIYGKADLTGKIVISISRKDLTTPTRYNTYTNFGLPPGPIANPGKEALLAVIKPDTTPYLFFVSQNDGTHIFSETYKAHHEAVKKFQLDAKAREGKSWRDLQKRNQPAVGQGT
ncbi:hypothetical protein BDW_00550 [Bdellovibrio bacteriovorus W]|nr:hypothetical protein BDW_00550 [Bdellovibrio bacteriovorus W]